MCNISDRRATKSSPCTHLSDYTNSLGGCYDVPTCIRWGNVERARMRTPYNMFLHVPSLAVIEYIFFLPSYPDATEGYERWLVGVKLYFQSSDQDMTRSYGTKIAKRFGFGRLNSLILSAHYSVSSVKHTTELCVSLRLSTVVVIVCHSPQTVPKPDYKSFNV